MVEGFEFEDQDSCLRVQGLKLRAEGFGSHFRLEAVGFKHQDANRVEGSRFRV
jgi:hypothetical protein